MAYSTVQTLLNIMEDEEGAGRHVVEGRTFIYIPTSRRTRTIRELTRRFVDRVFDGTLDRVMVALLDTRPPAPRGMRSAAGDDRQGEASNRKPSPGGSTSRVTTSRVVAAAPSVSVSRVPFPFLSRFSFCYHSMNRTMRRVSAAWEAVRHVVMG